MKSNHKNSESKIHFMTKSAVLSALICIFSPVTVPIGPVPVTLGLFAVMLAGVVFESKKSLLAVMAFVLIGACGLPVFAGAKGGLSSLIGPTGGYIWSYFLVAFAVSKVSFRSNSSFAKSFLGCVLGMIVCYILGTAQFVILAENISFKNALKICVYPFIVFDLIKAVCAAMLGESIKKRMR